jgi:alpha-1,2-mannosyltransferase
VDAFFYHDFVIVPLKIVLYNILSGSDRGPNIFGTEPWDFYSRNLLLNFNVWYLLAVAVGPLLYLRYAFRSQATTKQTLLREAIFTMPFYAWMTIFTLQPHKEERFMYPVYPFLALNAAIAFHIVLTYFGSTNPKELVAKIPVQLRLAVALITVTLSLNIGLLRTIGTVTAYRAPLQVYRTLEAPGMARPGETVCLGKEWYRFPSSFSLPRGTRAKFIKSEFSGLLPGEFNEAKTGFGFFAGTWLIPAGMNDRNEEDVGKYVSFLRRCYQKCANHWKTDISHCTYLVDSYLPGSQSTQLEPRYLEDEKVWKKVSCAPFLDTARTTLLARTIWIPDLPIIPSRYRRQWGDYCLLQRR